MAVALAGAARPRGGEGRAMPSQGGGRGGGRGCARASPVGYRRHRCRPAAPAAAAEAPPPPSPPCPPRAASGAAPAASGSGLAPPIMGVVDGRWPRPLFPSRRRGPLWPLTEIKNKGDFALIGAGEIMKKASLRLWKPPLKGIPPPFKQRIIERRFYPVFKLLFLSSRQPLFPGFTRMCWGGPGKELGRNWGYWEHQVGVKEGPTLSGAAPALGLVLQHLL